MIKSLTHRSTTNYSPANASENAKPFVQPKLTINTPGDVFEQEADATADRVMRMEKTDLNVKPTPFTTVQRKCAACEEEDKKIMPAREIKPLTTQATDNETNPVESVATAVPVIVPPIIQRHCAACEAEKKEKVQRKENGEQQTEGDDSLESYVGNLAGSGQSLPNDVRNYYEPRFGYDFSAVKIHTDSGAAASARSINALAYTTGNNIVFNNGQYSPDNDSGKRLLAHELTHVIHQSGAVQKKIMRQQRITPPARTDCPTPGPNDFIRLIVVNQETPQSVTIFWNYSNTTETDQCSTGKGGCCIPAGASNDTVGCTETQSRTNGSNCTPIGVFAVNDIRRQSRSGVDFWTQIVGSPRWIALHEYTPVDGTPLSHGCVRMNHDMAVKIYCGSIVGRTMVEVRGFTRPLCTHSTLVNEWRGDFSTATHPPDGDPHVRETRNELIRHLRLGTGRAAERELDRRLSGMTDANTGQINPALVTSNIPTCTGVSGLGDETERLQPIKDLQVGVDLLNVLLGLFGTRFPGFLNHTIIANMRTQLGLARNLSDATASMQQIGSDLWTHYHASTTPPLITVNDRELYWTRLFIIRELRQWHPVFTLTTAQRTSIIELFEMASRGLSVTRFRNVAPGVKKILISGFDPFDLNATGITAGNPSGAVVLALDRQTVHGTNCNAEIQGAVFPVEYREFDQGMVESYFGNFLSGANRVDMIMTISLSPGNRTATPALDRWAARERGGHRDNDEQPSTDAQFESGLRTRYPTGVHARDEFIESTLPVTEMSAGGAASIDEGFLGTDSTGSSVSTSSTQRATPPAGTTAVSGSGGDFLSNEIFYRVRLLQLNQPTANNIPMGHLHVPNTPPSGYGVLVDRVKLILRNSLTFLCRTP